jgi:hypothetical protein
MQTVIDETTALRDSEGMQTRVMVAMRSAGTRPGHAWKKAVRKKVLNSWLGAGIRSAND